ncbi:uncharacterized protein TNCV_3484651 [Trichonephila clavipes]|nr:uncharacterized protein TNCV_3484651 [Trichonephila clavipes]
MYKRGGSRLRKLKTKTKGLSGKGKLTDNFIDRLQNYYGIAVRSNVDNLTVMQQNVIAALYHCASSDKKPMHGLVGVDGACVNKIFIWPKRKKCRQERSGERAGRFTGPPRPIHRPGYAVSNALHTSTLKCAGASSCWNPIQAFMLALLTYSEKSSSPKGFRAASDPSRSILFSN